MMDSEMWELRDKVSMLEVKADLLTDKVADLGYEATILELGWSRLDIDLYSKSFLLSRSKAEQEEYSREAA